MFELYFCPRVVRRLQANTQSAVLEGLLADLHGRGYSRNTIQIYVGAAEAFLRWLRRRRQPLEMIDEATVREFACRRRSNKRPRSNTHAALRHLLRRLRANQTVPPAAMAVRHRVPVGRAVTRELIRGVMRRAYVTVPGCEQWTGTHILRHTAATRLHHAGADLKCVADILGHRSIDTTAIYTKVALDQLAATALPWPGSAEVQS